MNTEDVIWMTQYLTVGGAAAAAAAVGLPWGPAAVHFHVPLLPRLLLLPLVLLLLRR